MRNKFKWVKVVGVGLVSVAMTGAAFAQTSGSDPSTAIVATLGTYATDVGLIAVAVLTIVYGKKLVGYLKV